MQIVFLPLIDRNLFFVMVVVLLGIVKFLSAKPSVCFV